MKLLAPHLTEANHKVLIDSAQRRSKREIEQVLARLHPRPDVPSLVRKLPTRPGAAATAAPPTDSASSATAPASGDRTTSPSPDIGTAAMFEIGPDGPPVTRPQRAVIAPLAPERYKVQMTISEETHDRLCHAQALLRHAVPNGDVAAIFDRALVVLVKQLERRKWGATKELRRTTTTVGEERVKAPGRSRPPRKSARKCPPPTAAWHARGSDDATAVSVGSGEAVEQVPARVLELAVSRTGGFGDATAVSVASGAVADQVLERVLSVGETAVGARQEGLPVKANAAKRARRLIPAAVRRSVWLRAGGQCSYVSVGGLRCASKSRLEFHHSVPCVDGGQSVEGSVKLLCAAHHARETARWFGE